MGLLSDNLEVWWKHPQDFTKRNTHREVSMLELFYDLSYVVLVVQLTHILVNDTSMASVVEYSCLFSFVYWAWFNGSLYHEYFGNLDFKTRLIIFIQMLILVGMGVTIGNAFSTQHVAFAVFYGFFFLVMTILWIRVIHYDKEIKPIVNKYVLSLGFISISFFISAFTTLYIARILWVVSIGVSVIDAIVFMARDNKAVNQDKLNSFKNIGESFVERFGLMATIILGEGVAALVEGGVEVELWTVTKAITIVGSFILIVFVWWLYFDFVSRRLPRKDNFSRSIWLGFHLPLFISLGLISVGILNLLITRDFLIADKLLLVKSLIVFLICVMGLKGSVKIPEFARPIYKASYINKWAAIVGLVLVAIFATNKTVFVWLCVLCLFIPIRVSFRMWIEIRSKMSFLGNAE